MSLIQYIKSVLQPKSGDSVKSLVLFLSAVTGALLCLTLCFVMIYDVTTNGYLKTNLSDAGIFIICVGGYMAGAGIPKVLIDKNRDKIESLFRHESTTNESKKEEIY